MRSAQVCRHLARKVSDGSWPGVTWGIAGRSRTKLEDKVQQYYGRKGRPPTPVAKAAVRSGMILFRTIL